MMRDGVIWVWACLLLCVFTGTARAEETALPRCVTLNQVDVGEHEILDRQHQRKLVEPYLGQCIDGKLLKALISDISAFYMQRGNITVRPYLKQQTIADGQIDISILKGSVEDIVDADTHQSSGRIQTAFAFQKGHPLNLRDIETALEMINRPPSADASFAIKPGSEPGASIIEVKKHDASPWHLKLGVTERRQRDRNETFLTAEASIDNPLNINDIFTFRLNNSQLQRQQQSTRSGDINYSFPVASYLLEFVASRFFYQQGIQGVNDTFLADGRADGLRVRVNKVLMRNQVHKTSVAVSVYHKNSRNFLAGAALQVSSYKTTVLQLDATHLWLRDWGSLAATYSYYQGTDWFGARKDGFFGIQTGNQGRARLQFRKHTLDVALDYRFGDTGWRLTSRTHIQRTLDELFDNDKLSVGGDYTVRGYPDGTLYGNNAWYVRNDLTKSWAMNISPAMLQSLSLFGGFDYGHVRCEADNPLSCGNVYGAVAGLRSQGARLISTLTLGWPLKQVSSAFRRKPTIRMDMTWGF